MISVAIATYNGEKYVYQQLLSIYNQSHKVDEVIISDDVSTDNTVKIVKDFIRVHNLDNWFLIINKTNLGFSRNFFSAIKKTTGDIIFLCDQDDVWEIDKVKIMSSIMSNYSEICSLTSRYSIINDLGKQIDGHVMGPYKFNNSGKMDEITVEYLLGSSTAAGKGCNMCIKKNVRDTLCNIDELELSLSLGHDWYLSIIAAIIGKNYRLNRSLLRYRVHSSNASLVGLRKSHLLSSTNELRNKGFKQVIVAHQYLLSSNYISSKINNKDKKMINIIIKFYSDRLSFTTTRNIIILIKLIYKIKLYYQCEKKIYLAMRLFCSDILYAYHINWRLFNR